MDKGGRIISEYLNPHLGEFKQVLEEHAKRIYFEGKKLVKYSNNKEYFEEIMQEGRIGLFEAYRKYDPKRYAVKFWSFAWQRVRGRMVDFISKHSNFIKPNRTIEEITNKIQKLDMNNWNAKDIAETINCPIIQVTEALEFLRHKTILSLNQTMNNDNENSAELIDLLQDTYDYFNTNEETLWNFLSSDEQQYLSYKLQDYSIKRIQREMKLTNKEQDRLESSLKRKAKKVFFDLDISKSEVNPMSYNSNKLPLSKATYMKLKENNNLTDKEICKKHNISKSTLIKYKTSWGIISSRSGRNKQSIIAISAFPKVYEDAETTINGDGEVDQVNNFIGRISELESQLRETEEKLRISENEREALWRIQDILRSRLGVLPKNQPNMGG